MTARLAFERVTCVRGGRVLFADLSFDCAAGTALVVTGPNGVGKSSMVRMAAGLLRAEGGVVTIRGQRALLGETSALEPALPLARALGFWAGFDGHLGAVPDALAAFELTALAQAPVRLLSTGQRKRAGLARVAASRAAVWLLDEPANGLDAAAVLLLERAIDRHRAGGGIVLVATHQPIAMHAAQHIALEGAA